MSQIYGEKVTWHNLEKSLLLKPRLRFDFFYVSFSEENFLFDKGVKNFTQGENDGRKAYSWS